MRNVYALIHLVYFSLVVGIRIQDGIHTLGNITIGTTDQLDKTEGKEKLDVIDSIESGLLGNNFTESVNMLKKVTEKIAKIKSNGILTDSSYVQVNKTTSNLDTNTSSTDMINSNDSTSSPDYQVTYDSVQDSETSNSTSSSNTTQNPSTIQSNDLSFNQTTHPLNKTLPKQDSFNLTTQPTNQTTRTTPSTPKSSSYIINSIASLALVFIMMSMLIGLLLFMCYQTK